MTFAVRPCGFVRVLAGGLELTFRRVSTRGAAGGTGGKRLDAESVGQEGDVASDVGRSIDCEPSRFGVFDGFEEAPRGWDRGHVSHCRDDVVVGIGEEVLR